MATSFLILRRTAFAEGATAVINSVPGLVGLAGLLGWGGCSGGSVGAGFLVGDYGGYFGVYAGGTPAPTQPSVVVIAPQPAIPAPFFPAMPPPRPEIRDYNWPASSSGSMAETFAIVTKDQRSESAIAVW